MRLEKVTDREAGCDYPVCVAFSGDSPVEYPSEDEPEEPTPFDLDSVNRLLARLNAIKDGADDAE